ncbi:MAG: SpoIID/LytB domain-containing protein [Prevotellaceae bacterium]|jgi:stage II sporulation protein D|nr:SpoIID/LytB domain-containing protein [Prevotellaceae bacterium]
MGYRRVGCGIAAYLFFSLSLCAQKVSVGLFFDVPVRAATFAVQSGSYAIIVDDTLLIAAIDRGGAMQLSHGSSGLRLRISGESMGVFSSVKAVGMGDEGIFSITCINPPRPSRSYTQHAFIRSASDGSGMLIVNQLDEHFYLNGVVEAETGCAAKPEFFKAQAILSRTYLYAHFNRHAKDGFNLCDGVHCQAYNGLLTRCRRIRDMVGETEGTIVIDGGKRPITPSFHANCGGQTCHSENVWREKLPYLRSVKDGYCKFLSGARWQKRIALNEWRHYMGKNGIRAKTPKQFEFAQASRKKYYEVNGKKVELAKIRQRFGLRSTFFEVQVAGNDVLLTGRGYGHGVGLCQEGAMQMAERGMTCENILHRYYTNTRIVNFNKARSTPAMQQDSMLFLFNPWRNETPDTTTFIDDNVARADSIEAQPPSAE